MEKENCIISKTGYATEGDKRNCPALSREEVRPLQMTFEDQLNALIYFHLETHTSGRHLIQSLTEDDLAREHIAPEDGIQKSSFFEAINTRGLEQLIQVFESLRN
jgi:hypothetical protein